MGGVPVPLAAVLVVACQQSGGTIAEARAPCRAVQPRADPLAVEAALLPALTGHVVDGADLLSEDEEARLAELPARLAQRTGDQFAVVTVPTLGGYAIQDFGVALGRSWRLGQADKDNGILLIVAPNERKARIEVGYGLEPILTNERAAQIMQSDLIPAFRRGAFALGIEEGSRAIVATLVSQADAPRIGAC